jgi:RNA polymerase sigma factor (sigma-70 family)
MPFGMPSSSIFGRTEPGSASKGSWSDTRLVRACVRGDDEAWSVLVRKYKNLIFSIPVRYGFSHEEAKDVFQAVCLDLISELSELRDARALPAWLIRVTSHKCAQIRRRQNLGQVSPTSESDLASLPDRSRSPEDLLSQIEAEQTLRDSIAALPPRCRRLVEMLFFESPSRPYSEVARSLGLASGSIGFIRRRCLERLRSSLARRGFE